MPAARPDNILFVDLSKLERRVDLFDATCPISYSIQHAIKLLTNERFNSFLRQGAEYLFEGTAEVH